MRIFSKRKREIGEGKVVGSVKINKTYLQRIGQAGLTDIEKYLIPAGFQLYDISHISKNPMNGRTDWVDVIYINNRIRK